MAHDKGLTGLKALKDNMDALEEEDSVYITKGGIPNWREMYRYYMGVLPGGYKGRIFRNPARYWEVWVNVGYFPKGAQMWPMYHEILEPFVSEDGFQKVMYAVRDTWTAPPPRALCSCAACCLTAGICFCPACYVLNRHSAFNSQLDATMMQASEHCPASKLSMELIQVADPDAGPWYEVAPKPDEPLLVPVDVLTPQIRQPGGPPPGYNIVFRLKPEFVPRPQDDRDVYRDDNYQGVEQTWQRQAAPGLADHGFRHTTDEYYHPGEHSLERRCCA